MKKLLVLATAAVMTVSFASTAQAASMEATCNDYGFWLTKEKLTDDVGDLRILAKRKRVENKGGFDKENVKECRREMKKGELRAKRQDKHKNK